MKQNGDYSNHSPCDNWYEYACSKANTIDYFDDLFDANVKTMVKEMKNERVSLSTCCYCLVSE